MTSRILGYAKPVLFLAVWAIALTGLPAPAPATASELAEVAIGYYKIRDLPRMRTTFKEALAQDPQDFRTNFVAGVISHQERDWKEARTRLEAAHRLRPDDIETALTLGVVYHHEGEYEPAARLYKRVQALDPKNPRAAYNMGQLCVTVLAYGQAQTYLKQYLQLAPQAPDRPEVERLIGQLQASLKASKTKS